jgi:Spy/CpxP family protein refolding chaperone
MRRYFCSIFAIGLFATLTSAAPQTQSLAGLAIKTNPEQALKAYRNDLQAERTDLMARNLTLTADQAAKFWPAYAKFQTEQAAIIDKQVKIVQKYVDVYSNLDDSTAFSLAGDVLDEDQQMTELRRKWLAEFRKILPPRLAARVIQIDRRLGLTSQLAFAAQLPLIY